MTVVLSREQMQAFDSWASERCQVPSLLLMENAGRGAAEAVLRALPGARTRPARVVVIAGPGNNGGDGFVVARVLTLHELNVEVFLTTSRSRLRGDAATMCRAFLGIGGRLHELSSGASDQQTDEQLQGASSSPSSPNAWQDALDRALRNADVIVDAVFGTGLDRPLTGFFAQVVERINQASLYVAALDIPSGLDANTGQTLGVAVRADLTITFAHAKPGLLTTRGCEQTGKLAVVDIGVPARLYEHVGCTATLFSAAEAEKMLEPRPASMHKSEAGRVMVVAGSAGKTGAALLVSRGAMRAGAGLVTLLGLPELTRSLDLRVLEAMTHSLDPKDLQGTTLSQLDSAHAVAVGPGLGLDDTMRDLVDAVVLNWPGSVVLDADGLTHFEGRVTELKKAPGKLVLTPHPGEAARLLEVTVSDVENDRFGWVRELSERTGASVLLKGPKTLVASPNREISVNMSGHPAMAAGGAGDVLTGIIATLMVEHDPHSAACLGAYLHGRAGELWAEQRRSDRGLLAHELADLLPTAIAALASRTAALPE